MHCLRTIIATASLSLSSTLAWRSCAAVGAAAATAAGASSTAAALLRVRSAATAPCLLGYCHYPSKRYIGSGILRAASYSRTSSSLAFQNNNGQSSASSSLVSPSPIIRKASSSSVNVEDTKPKSPIPIILLAGFLGSGKTSTLKHLMENNSNIKIGVVVNDVASVNIDAKLLSNTGRRANSDYQGSDEEASSSSTNTVTSFMDDGDNDDDDDDTVELQNGCACCSLSDELLTSVVRLTKGGTRQLDAIIVELSGVSDPMAVKENWEQAVITQHPATRLASLERTVTLIDACTFGTDWMTWDTAGDRSSWMEESSSGGGDHHAAVRKVPELLAEQVEAADLLLVNKIDLAGTEQAMIAAGVARGLNDRANVMEVEFGRVDARELLGELNYYMEEQGHDHHHDHEDGKPVECRDLECTDTSHSHSHEHSSASCSDPDCADISHSHTHDHEHSSSTVCSNPDCTDTSHSHTHEHKHATASTAVENLGISSFVYKASVPFHSQRLLALLNRWPVPMKDTLDLGLVVAEETPDIERAFVGVLRSKGFCWMAPTHWTPGKGGKGDVWRHDTAMYWSHAGRHFGITSAGKWWGSLRKEQIKPYFANNMKEYDRIMREDWVSEEWGDRRQELVFIGSRLDEDEIRAALDNCLCTEDEMEIYRFKLRNYLDTMFSSEKGGPSLFNVGEVDHIDDPGN
ncbi:hypothetical protein ACHAWU_008951 [Discostella pseudostelligera]|uniref:CobW C-terminal domain-containing protein n=1 Tax=Discostella pseudostelligera TaxID=259834 RepID=A0ABD3MH48_9STRA